MGENLERRGFRNSFTKARRKPEKEPVDRALKLEGDDEAQGLGPPHNGLN